MICPACNKKMVWQSDFDSEDYGYEDSGIVTIYECPECESQFIHVKLEKENENNG
jgi:endogenous inhibitor of DNA gyrase (YacG/DUF329 family)